MLNNITQTTKNVYINHWLPLIILTNSAVGQMCRLTNLTEISIFNNFTPPPKKNTMWPVFLYRKSSLSQRCQTNSHQMYAQSVVDIFSQTKNILVLQNLSGCLSKWQTNPQTIWHRLWMKYFKLTDLFN